MEATVRVLQCKLAEGRMSGELAAGVFQWTFNWYFRQGVLRVHPAKGRALISEPLQRFLEQQDYALEVGEVYTFTLRSKL